MIVIGIDPGAANTGFGVVRTMGERMVALDGGVIETAPEMPAEERLAKIHDGLGQLIAWHEPEAMALEDLYFGKNVGSALSVGQARGVAMLAAAQREVPCFDYTPQAVKKAVSGSGSADKAQVQHMVGRAARAARAAGARSRGGCLRRCDLPRGRRRDARGAGAARTRDAWAPAGGRPSPRRLSLAFDALPLASEATNRLDFRNSAVVQGVQSGSYSCMGRQFATVQ